MLTERRIELGLAGEGAAAVELAVAAVVGEEGQREVLRLLKPQIDRGFLPLGVVGTP